LAQAIFAVLGLRIPTIERTLGPEDANRTGVGDVLAHVANTR
jgi:hypothetical protein